MGPWDRDWSRWFQIGIAAENVGPVHIIGVFQFSWLSQSSAAAPAQGFFKKKEIVDAYKELLHTVCNEKATEMRWWTKCKNVSLMQMNNAEIKGVEKIQGQGGQVSSGEDYNVQY